MASTKKPKHITPTEEEIKKKTAQLEMVKAMRIFVRDSFYPALLESTDSIDDAKFLLSSFSNMLMEQFLSQMKEKKFIELELRTKLDKNSPKYKKYLKLLAIFGDKSVYDARELIEGMKNEIEMMISSEMKERPLDSLKTMFYE